MKNETEALKVINNSDEDKIPAEYQNTPDHPFSMDKFAKKVTAENLPVFLTRLANETKPGEKHRAALIKKVSKTLGMNTKDIENQLATYEPLSPGEKNLHILNKKHAVININGKCYIMNEVIDPDTFQPSINFSSIHDFRNFYLNKMIVIQDPSDPSKSKKINVAEHWLLSTKRREYEGIVFRPDGADVRGYYNMWRGFAITPKPGDWTLMKNHIHDVICAGDKMIYNWVMTWLARIVQDPGGERPGTSIVLKGPQGTGKGIFVSNFGAFFGGHYIHLLSPNQLSGRFNSHIKGKILIFCDEAFWSGDKTAEGVLKGIITEKFMSIEYKGKDIMTIQNYANIIMASNNSWVVPAGIEERRFCILEVSSKFIQNRQYFDAISKQMNNGGREAMLYDLLNWDITWVNLRSIPRTVALFDQILKSMSTVQQFWYEFLKDSSLLPMKKNDQGGYILTKEMRVAFITFAREHNGKLLCDSALGKELKDVCPNISRKRLSTGSRNWAYFIPSHTECRKAFESKVKMKIDWEE